MHTPIEPRHAFRPESDAADARSAALEGVSVSLTFIRRLLIADDGTPREHHAHRDLFHMYLSGWQVGLFADRPGTGLPDQLQTELDYFIEECSDAVLGALTPELATEGLNQLAGWLRVQGYEDSADAITNLRDRIEAPPRRPFPGSIPKWGMSDGPYFTYRGAVISPFFDRVQRYFAEKLAAQDSPDGS